MRTMKALLAYIDIISPEEAIVKDMEGQSVTVSKAKSLLYYSKT